MISLTRCLSCVSFGALLILLPAALRAETPNIPQDFRYQIYSDTAVELFWSRSVEPPARGYEIIRNGSNLGVFDALSYFDSSIIPGIEYTYSISAVGVDGDRSGEASVSLRTPESADNIANLQQQIIVLQEDIAFLEALLSEGVRSPVPQSGQQISIQPGDDGDLQVGVQWPDPRFSVNVEAAEDLNQNGICDSNETCNGTVTDNLTGLIWLRNANCFNERSWSDAINDARELAGDGSNACNLVDNSESGDWRLPNIREIQSLMDYQHSFPVLLLPTDHPFLYVQAGGINTSPDSYWTSTSTGSTSNGVYTVSISVGWVERWSLSADISFYVWPVRGGL